MFKACIKKNIGVACSFFIMINQETLEDFVNKKKKWVHLLIKTSLKLKSINPQLQKDQLQNHLLVIYLSIMQFIYASKYYLSIPENGIPP